MFKKKIMAILGCTIIVSGLAVGCSSGSSEGSGSKIAISGSTSVGPVMEVLGQEFEAQNEGISVEIQQIGSSAGVKNAIEGTSEIGMASRDIKEEEKAAGLEENAIGIDAIALVTNKANPVKDLTQDQIKDIYTGKVTNWKEVGGNDAPIVVVSREDGSGTRDGFQEVVGFESGELTPNAQIGDGSGNIKTTVAGNENAIGYVSLAYADESVTTLTVDGVEATAENVSSDAYKIARPFMIVNKADGLSENGQKLIDFILSEEGQTIVESKGLVKVK